MHIIKRWTRYPILHARNIEIAIAVASDVPIKKLSTQYDLCGYRINGIFRIAAYYLTGAKNETKSKHFAHVKFYDKKEILKLLETYKDKFLKD